MANLLKDSPGNRLLIRTIVTFLQSIGPLSLLSTVLILLRLLFPSSSYPSWPPMPPTSLTSYLALEAAFYLFFLYHSRTLQQPATHPPMHTRAQREALCEKVLSEIHDPEKFLTGWFRGAKVEDIGREDMEEFVNWSFWDGRAPGEADRAEIEEHVKKLEKMMARRFEEGKRGATALRLTVDPVIVTPRSLTWYTIIMLVDSLAFVLLSWAGMRYYRTTKSTWGVFPPRPAARVMAKGKSGSERLAYWVRPHRSSTRLPIVHLHGIGIGLLSYVEFLKELDTALNVGREDGDDQVGILVMEVLQISSRLTAPVPTKAEFLGELTKILDGYGWSRFVLSAHSYGSVISTHILSDPHLSARVSAVLLIDPVSILLHMPDVAYNFTIRPPVRANEWILWYFASKDPGVAHTLGRHFFWHENILWRDRIMELVEGAGTRFTVSLASDDLIVNTNAVGTYLSEYLLPDPVLVDAGTEYKHMELRPPANRDGWKRRSWRGKGLDFLWWPKYDHAEVFDKREDRLRLIDVLVKYSDGT